jgi:FAD:protein FMN transferase
MTVTDTHVTRSLHVERCMGTVFTIDIRDGGDWRDAVDEVAAWLHRVDAVFSTYRPDSDVSRLRRGELGVDDADPDVADVLDLCAEMRGETGGYFSVLSPTGLDPTGVVKGWAIERASHILRRHGSSHHAVNGGGDIQLAGSAGPEQAWRVGIIDPFDRTRVVTTVSGSDLAVATSGTAERGAHIVDPYTGVAPVGVASVTVVGRSLTRVDVYATAAFAMGPAALSWLDRLEGHEALVVIADGDVRATRGFERLCS